MLEELEEEGAEISYNDPFIPQFIHEDIKYASVEITDKRLKEADIVLITTAHTQYDFENIADKAELIFDTRNGTKGIESDNIYKL